MNDEWLKTFKKYRKRKFERDLKSMQEHQGLISVTIKEKEERWLEEDYEDELAMKTEEIAIYKTEEASKNEERKSTIFANRILSIIAIVTLVVSAGVSYFSIQNAIEANEISKDIFNRQQEEEFTRQRAYIFPDSKSVIDELVNNMPGYRISVIFKNVGQTPASNFSWKSYLLIEGQSGDGHTSLDKAVIGPGQVIQTNLGTLLKEKLSSYSLAKNTGNFFVVEYKYKTYLGECFNNKIFLTFDRVMRPGQEYTLGVSKQEDEQKIKCE
jgi:hypothetical protein